MSVDKSLFGRLGRLFNNNVIVRKVGKEKIRVIDNDHLQSLGNTHNSKFIDRFTRLHGVRPNGQNVYSPNYNYYASKVELYTDYEMMEQDSICSAALDVYMEECILKDDFGDILRISSDNEHIKKILDNLFYEVLNVEFNLGPWVRNMVKYGDFYLHLDIQDEIGIVNVAPMSSYEVIREEGMDLKKSPYHVQFRMQGAGNVVYENYEVAHFRLLSDSNFLPYGKSILEPARKVWKQLLLLEDAMLINRIMRAPEKRIFKIDVGNIPPGEVDAYMQKIINQMKKTPFVDQATGEYNLKFNMQNMLEDYFLPVRGGQSGTEIDTLSGIEFTGIEDINYLKDKLLAAIKVPKAFLNYTEDISGKATLAASDVRFARTIERIQRMIISELHKIAIIHLYAQGFTDAELIDFELTMTSPSTIYEQEKLVLYNTKVDLAANMLEKKIMSREWIFKNIFNFTPEEAAEIELGIIRDQKDAYRMTQLSDNGEDPADPKVAEKNAQPDEEDSDETSDKESAPTDKETEAPTFDESVDLSKEYDMRRSKNRNTPEVPKGGWPDAGRPKEGMKYNTHSHPRGYDPLGKVAMKKSRKIEATGKMYGLDRFKKSATIITESISILDERNILNEI